MCVCGCVCVCACVCERERMGVPGGSVMDPHTHTKRGRGRGRRGREVDKAPRVVVDVSAYNYQVYPGGKSISCQWTDIYRNQPQKRKEEKKKQKSLPLISSNSYFIKDFMGFFLQRFEFWFI